MKKVLSATTLKGSDKGKLLEALLEITDAVPLFDDRYTWDIRIIEEDGALGVEFTAKYYEENIDRWYRNIEEYGDTVDDIIANNDFYEDMIEFLSAEAEAIGIEKSITSSTVTPKRILSFICPICHNKTVYDIDRDVHSPLEAHYGDRFICDECGSEFEGSLGFDNKIHLDLIKEDDEWDDQMKRVIKSSAVTSQDDRYLCQFIYDYYKNWEEFPTYEEVLDEYDESVDRRTFKDASDCVSNGLAYISFYRYDGVEYIQLMHDPVLSWIRVPEEAASRLGEEALEQLYLEKVEQAKEEFLSKTGTEIYQLGRSGRHICVEDTIDNLLNSKQLYETAVQLEKDIISYMNGLT